MFSRKTPLEKELNKLSKQEEKYYLKKQAKKESKLNQLLEEKIPSNLQTTLDLAFAKAFYVVFENGTGIIEKTYNKENLLNEYKIHEYAASLKKNRKSLKMVSKKANSSGAKNLMMSGISGVGLGFLGIGIPDIVLFTGMLLKSLYELALSYGFDYESEEERIFILYLIQGALLYGEDFVRIDSLINEYIIDNGLLYEVDVEESIEMCAACLSKELLYMKFLQGIPLIGVIGGAYDAIYMNRVIEYAKMKYYRRFLYKSRG